MAFNIFAGMFQGRPQNNLNVNQSQNPLTSLPEDKPLSLINCQDIYTYWGLGKRIAHALPRFAMSAPREILIQDAEPEVVAEFIKTAENLKQDDMCSRAAIFCRIYGMAGLFVAYSKKNSFDKKDIKDKRNIENLTIKDVQDGKITFNAMNPLNLSGSTFNQDALSTKYQKPERIIVAGETVGSRRATIIQNSEPIYLRFATSTFTFSGISVYQNMVRLIKAWHRAVISLERMATKGSSIVFKDGIRGKMGGIQADAARSSLQRIKDMENDGAVSIDKDGDVTFFPLTGVQEVDTILKGLEREIMMAQDDTPLAILLDKSLSNGLSEGSEDMKAVIMAVNNFRKDFLTPLYNLTDPYVQAVAWSDSFIISIAKQYPEKYAGGYTVQQIRQMWQESFSYKYGNIYPESEKEIQETNKIILENIKVVSDMGGNSADIEKEIQERKIFKNNITIDPPPEPMPGFGDDEEEVTDQDNEGEEKDGKQEAFNFKSNKKE